MNNKFLLGIYSDEEALIKSAVAIKNEGFVIFDFYTPFPVHGLDDLLEIKRSRLPQITFIAGGIGLLVAIIFQVWTSAFDWPIDVGGKPMLSIAAFIPVTFELAILFGALATVAGFFIVSNLFPSKEAMIHELRQTDDQFILAMKNDFDSTDIEKINKILTTHGAITVKAID